jgi:dihydroxynaphthoic acid synthetase
VPSARLGNECARGSARRRGGRVPIERDNEERERTMSFEHILYEKSGGKVWISINHPERLNSFDDATCVELIEAFEAADADGSVGVIVLTGVGDRAFCSGGYLAGLADFEFERARRLFRTSSQLFQAIRRTRQPVIAAVNGYAIGGGNELVIACDLAIASENARFGQVGPKIGSSPVFGGTNLLAMNIGEKRAKEVCFMCRQYPASEALAMGWINAVVPHGELRAEVDRWCEDLLDRSPSYLELSKVTSNVWWDMLAPMFAHAEQTMFRLAGGPEQQEGTSAFMQKRKPDFRQFRKGTAAPGDDAA